MKRKISLILGIIIIIVLSVIGFFTAPITTAETLGALIGLGFAFRDEIKNYFT